jgi:predicted fused transcriptional regulator/phosphomethylpyrimidine kinase
MAVVVDGGGVGMEPMALTVVLDSGDKDAIAATAIDRRRSRR